MIGYAGGAMVGVVPNRSLIVVRSRGVNLWCSLESRNLDGADGSRWFFARATSPTIKAACFLCDSTKQLKSIATGNSPVNYQTSPMKVVLLLLFVALSLMSIVPIEAILLLLQIVLAGVLFFIGLALLVGGFAGANGRNEDEDAAQYGDLKRDWKRAVRR